MTERLPSGVILSVGSIGHAPIPMIPGLAQGFDVHAAANPQAGETWLSRSGHRTADVVVIGPDVEHPLATARRLRRRAAMAQMLFILPSDKRRRFADMLAFVPELADAWTADSATPPEELAEIIAAAVRTARDRRRTADVSQRIDQLMAAGPITSEEQRRRRRIALSERYLEGLLAQAPDPIIATDSSGLVIAWNAAAWTLFGARLDERESVPIADLLPDGDTGAVGDLVARVASGETGARYEARVRRPDGSLADVELNLAPIRDPMEQIVGVSAVARDVTERRRTEQSLSAALADRETLLNEVHHRVRNNLQVIISLIRLEEQEVEDRTARAKFDILAERIGTIARIHGQIYASESFAQVDFAAYLKQLCDDLADLYSTGGRIAITAAADRLFCDLDTAIPLGLITNELIGNALRHGFPGERSGTVAISLNRADGQVHLVVADNGIGMDSDARSISGLGLRIVEGLLRQTDAEAKWDTNGGTRVRIVIPGRSFADTRTEILSGPAQRDEERRRRR